MPPCNCADKATRKTSWHNLEAEHLSVAQGIQLPSGSWSEYDTPSGGGPEFGGGIAVYPEPTSTVHGVRFRRFEEERRTRETRMLTPSGVIETRRDRPFVWDMILFRIISEARSASVANGDKPRASATTEQQEVSRALLIPAPHRVISAGIRVRMLR